MKRDYAFIAMCLGLVTAMAGYGLWRYISPAEVGENFYFICIAGAFTFYTLSARITRRKLWKGEIVIKAERNMFAKFLVADMAFNLAATKLFTEIVLDGAKVQIYEYWNLALCVLILLIRLIVK